MRSIGSQGMSQLLRIFVPFLELLVSIGQLTLNSLSIFEDDMILPQPDNSELGIITRKSMAVMHRIGSKLLRGKKDAVNSAEGSIGRDLLSVLS